MNEALRVETRITSFPGRASTRPHRTERGPWSNVITNEDGRQLISATWRFRRPVLCQAFFVPLPSKRDHSEKPVFVPRASQCRNMPVRFVPILIALPLDQALKPSWKPSPG